MTLKKVFHWFLKRSSRNPGRKKIAQKLKVDDEAIYYSWMFLSVSFVCGCQSWLNSYITYRGSIMHTIKVLITRSFLILRGIGVTLFRSSFKVQQNTAVQRFNSLREGFPKGPLNSVSLRRFILLPNKAKFIYISQKILEPRIPFKLICLSSYHFDVFTYIFRQNMRHLFY